MEYKEVAREFFRGFKKWAHHALTEGRDLISVVRISARGPGYSGLAHYRFFRHMLFDTRPAIRKVLILGVYFGRDIMMIADLMSIT